MFFDARFRINFFGADFGRLRSCTSSLGVAM
jgi:hypothetical protein